MIELISEGCIPNTHNKRYIIDSPEDRSNLEVDFGNEAYCISNKTTYICNGSGVYVEKSSGGGGGSAPMVEVSYVGLVEDRDAGKLIPGQQYRITDYATIINGSYDLSAVGAQGYIHYARAVDNDLFDVIVTADDASHLNENARACRREGSTYAPDAKPEAWEIKYCLDNDTSRFAWADSTNGKGVIYEMRDEHNNFAGYDFKSIQFIRYALKLADDVPQEIIDHLTRYQWSFWLPFDANNPWNRYGSVYDVYLTLAHYMDDGTYQNPFKMVWNHNLSHVYDFYVGANILGVVQFPEVDDTYLSTFNADWYYTFDVYNNGEHKDGSILETACANNHIEPCLDMVAGLTGVGSPFGLNTSITCDTETSSNLYIGTNCYSNTVSTGNASPIIIDDNSVDNVVAGWRSTTITNRSSCNIVEGESVDIFISDHTNAYICYSSSISLNNGYYCTAVATYNVSLSNNAHNVSLAGCGRIQSIASQVGNLHVVDLQNAVLKGNLENPLTIPAGLGGYGNHEVIHYSGVSATWFTIKTGYNTETVLSTTDGGATWTDQ